MTVIGGNFSGRTTYLKDKSGFQSNTDVSRGKFQYLGSDVSNYISGVSSTVQEELNLHYSQDDLVNEPWVKNAIVDLLLSDKLDQNPFVLSGGEQTLLTILALVLKQNPCIALDCALEQLSETSRNKVFHLFGRLDFLKSVLIADNRLREFDCFDESSQVVLKKRIQDQEINPEEYLAYINDSYSIEIENLNFTYKAGKKIFTDASFNLDVSQVLVLKGENGSGKSTFSKLMCGILEAESGVFSANGKEFRPFEHPAEVFAYHFQNPDLQLFSNNVYNEIKLSAKNKTDKNILSILKTFGLESSRNKHPMDLSFSLRKRLAMGVTFAMERPWVILDEPSIGQDDESIIKIAEIIKKQSLAGTGFIVISHSKSFISLLDYRSFEIRKGQFVEENKSD